MNTETEKGKEEEEGKKERSILEKETVVVKTQKRLFIFFEREMMIQLLLFLI